MQYILVVVGKETPDLSAVEICKVFENSHLGVKAAFIVRDGAHSYDEDIELGKFYTTSTAVGRLMADVLEDH